MEYGQHSPDTYEDYCIFTASDLTLEIYSSITGDWCFYSEGYVGLGSTSSGPIYGVVYIESYHGAYGWVMYYQPPYSPGTGISFNFGTNKFYGNPPFTGNQKITQVNVVGYNCQINC